MLVMPVGRNRCFLVLGEHFDASLDEIAAWLHVNAQHTRPDDWWETILTKRNDDPRPNVSHNGLRKPGH